MIVIRASLAHLALAALAAIDARSAEGRCKSATGYLRPNVRNGGAFADGLSPTLPMA